MPAPLAVDRDAVKAHALMHGVRAAADAFGLPHGTVCAWSKREAWLQSARDAAKADTAQLPASMRPVASGAIKSASEAAQTAMQRLHSRSRLNSAIGAAKAAKHVKRLSPASAFEQIDRIDKLASTINRLHGSPDAATQATRPIRLELLASATAQVIDADWTAQPQLQDCDGAE